VELTPQSVVSSSPAHILHEISIYPRENGSNHHATIKTYPLIFARLSHDDVKKMQIGRDRLDKPDSALPALDLPKRQNVSDMPTVSESKSVLTQGALSLHARHPSRRSCWSLHARILAHLPVKSLWLHAGRFP
jgi:hypothetical protein